MYQKIFKRLMDLGLSITGFILLMPLFIPITILLLIEHKGRAFFIQSRPGQHERSIAVYKFKTMNDKTDSEGNLLPNHVRTTRTGRILRASSLDELPQLINVIKGDMSLVGPRPLLFKYIPLYSPEQRERHLVKPGITGLAQVNGRNAISWTKKLAYDHYYVHHISVMLDMKILLKTAGQVLTGNGVNAGKDVTMPPFNGTN